MFPGRSLIDVPRTSTPPAFHGVLGLLHPCAPCLFSLVQANSRDLASVPTLCQALLGCVPDTEMDIQVSRTLHSLSPKASTPMCSLFTEHLPCAWPWDPHWIWGSEQNRHGTLISRHALLAVSAAASFTCLATSLILPPCNH